MKKDKQEVVKDTSYINPKYKIYKTQEDEDLAYWNFVKKLRLTKKNMLLDF